MRFTYCYDDISKRRKASEYRSQLRKVASALGLSKVDYDLRFNPGGIAVWGEVTLHTEHFYVQASHGTELGVLVRTCKGRKDYTGGVNNWFSFSLLKSNPVEFARRLRLLSERSIFRSTAA